MTAGVGLSIFFLIILAGGHSFVTRTKPLASQGAGTVNTAHSSIRFNLANAIAIGTIFFQLVQYCAFSFRENIAWALPSHGVRAAFQLDNFEDLAVPFTVYLVLALALAFFTFCAMLPFIVRRDGRTLASQADTDTFIAAVLIPVPVILALAVLFMPVVNALVSALSCTYFAVGRSPYVDREPSVQCWSGAHAALYVPAVFALAVFIPTGLRTIPFYKSSADLNPDLDIFFTPRFLELQMLVQIVLCIFSALLQRWVLLNTILLFVTLFCMTLVTATMHQTRKGILMLCVVCQALATHCALCAILAAAMERSDGEPSYVPFTALILGVVCIVVVTVLLQLGWIRAPRVLVPLLNHALSSTRPCCGGDEEGGEPGSQEGLARPASFAAL